VCGQVRWARAGSAFAGSPSPSRVDPIGSIPTQPAPGSAGGGRAGQAGGRARPTGERPRYARTRGLEASPPRRRRRARRSGEWLSHARWWRSTTPPLEEACPGGRQAAVIRANARVGGVAAPEEALRPEVGRVAVAREMVEEYYTPPWRKRARAAGKRPRYARTRALEASPPRRRRRARRSGEWLSYARWWRSTTPPLEEACPGARQAAVARVTVGCTPRTGGGVPGRPASGRDTRERAGWRRRRPGGGAAPGGRASGRRTRDGGGVLHPPLGGSVPGRPASGRGTRDRGVYTPHWRRRAGAAGKRP
jgi:hypothetical protein